MQRPVNARNDRSITGLFEVTAAPGFWPKLALYGFHYVSLIAGLVGRWLTRRRWRLTLPLAGFILYTLLIHLLLDAIPRYIFPTSVFWWVFAGIALGALGQQINFWEKRLSVNFVAIEKQS